MDKSVFNELIHPLKRRKYFDGDESSYIKELYNFISSLCNLTYPTEEYNLELSDRFPVEQQASNPVNLQIIKLLIQIKNCKSILEIGSFIGVSAISMAQALPDDGKILTIEKYDYFAGIANRNIISSGFQDKIELINGDAFEVLQQLNPERKFDLIFLDGNKERYDVYFEMLENKLDKGGIFLIDDIFFEGDILNQEHKTEKAKGISKMLDLVKSRNNYFKSVLPIGNGFLILIKNN